MIDRRFVFAALALLAACSSHSPSRSTPVPVPALHASAGAPHSDSPHSLLLISIDGLRADMLDRGITPNLSQLAHDGVRARWMTPSYPSLTFPNHYTLVTGLRPDHHGIVHNSMRDATLGGFWLSKQDAVGDARWWGGEPLWVGAETHGLHAATWSWPGFGHVFEVPRAQAVAGGGRGGRAGPPPRPPARPGCFLFRSGANAGGARRPSPPRWPGPTRVPHGSPAVSPPPPT
ncbi:ectonucleotide pyrophosphatase/phosphodiesterase, partial [Xanthomonas arboricola]|uniref:alkaline phosphatase family protein n=1 Tax=Xanthomonas arboricola TaxID=56448 RepID=UPI000A5575EE